MNLRESVWQGQSPNSLKCDLRMRKTHTSVTCVSECVRVSLSLCICVFLCFCNNIFISSVTKKCISFFLHTYHRRTQAPKLGLEDSTLLRFTLKTKK